MSKTTNTAKPRIPTQGALARSVLGGKRTERIESRVTDELKDALRRRCNDLGMTESDFIERLVAVSIFGVEHVQMVEEQRLRGVCGLSGLYPAKGG